MAGPYRDWSWIVQGKIAQGAYPGAHPGLFQAFDIVVYTAQEKQPKIPTPVGKLALYAPLDDDVYRPVPREIGRQLHVVAQQIASHVSRGKSALITCQQGRNRSGLVTGLTLLKLYPGWTPQQAITLIQRNRRHRDGALANTMFTQYLLAHGRNP